MGHWSIQDLVGDEKSADGKSPIVIPNTHYDLYISICEELGRAPTIKEQQERWIQYINRQETTDEKS